MSEQREILDRLRGFMPVSVENDIALAEVMRMNEPQTRLRCPRCGPRDASEFYPVARSVPPCQERLIDAGAPAVELRRHRPCGAFVWAEVADASTSVIITSSG